ncbi:MAG: helix-turn-helix domain-containing protein, partial [Gemmatimonadales bacterium]|mgnify:CR=1 FL=1|nr:helix-turn-helix domain-containing protein [Gemmatimonadales bacterium]
MNKATRTRLEAHGWQVGTAAEFLGLSPEEAAFVELRLSLAEALRTRRTARRLTQAALAKRVGSSQSRVAKMEAGDPSVSIDLLLRSLLALGATPREIGSSLTRRRKRRVAV